MALGSGTRRILSSILLSSSEMATASICEKPFIRSEFIEILMPRTLNAVLTGNWT